MIADVQRASRRTGRVRIYAILLIASLGTSELLHAMWWIQSIDVPTDRLITNVERILTKDSKKAANWYVLGRLHSYAFFLLQRTITIAGKELDAESVPPLVAPRVLDMSISAPETRFRLSTANLPHLTAALKAFQRAIELVPDKGEYHLSLGYAIEAGSPFADQVDSVDCFGVPVREPNADDEDVLRWIEDLTSEEQHVRSMAIWALSRPADSNLIALNERREEIRLQFRTVIGQLLRDHWEQRAIAEYRRAFDLECEGRLPRQAPTGPGGLHYLTVYEAGCSLRRLITKRAIRTDAEFELLTRVESKLREVEALPVPMPLTPIVFSLQSSESIEELLDPSRRVLFDLDGNGIREPWPWVRSHTSFLVWDAHCGGRIESGRQLIGSASWWMCFENGYDVLTALDDDQNGWLQREELSGLGMWTDRNGDAISQAGEVTPIEQSEVIGICTSGDEIDGVSPCNRSGLLLRDGRRLPTYDWTLYDAPEPSRGAILRSRP
jgi:hypothetical protein